MNEKTQMRTKNKKRKINLNRIMTVKMMKKP